MFSLEQKWQQLQKNVCSVHKEKEFTFLQLCCLSKRVKDIIMAWYGCKLVKKSKVFEEVVNKVLTAHCLNQSSSVLHQCFLANILANNWIHTSRCCVLEGPQALPSHYLELRPRIFSSTSSGLALSNHFFGVDCSKLGVFCCLLATPNTQQPYQRDYSLHCRFQIQD